MARVQPLDRTGISEIISEEDLNRLLSSKKKLNIKFGIDPTSKDVHLGHAISFHVLRRFQDMGHKVFLIIGDFTAAIGDPSGFQKTRPVLTKQEITENVQGYVNQASLILDIKKAEVVYNSSWLNNIPLSQFIEYATLVSVNGLIEREDFSQRLKTGQSLSLHELIYPVVQALDSVELKADIEIGGWDQRLNLLTARELQKKMGQPSETIIMVKNLIGTDGVKKMSKSYGNYIALTDSASDMFGKIMSIKDEMIQSYAELASMMDEFECRRLETLHPKQAKIEVAKKVVEIYHGKEASLRSAEDFEDTFSNRQVSDAMIEKVKFEDEEVTLIQAVAKCTGFSSTESRRLIDQGGVKVDDEVVSDKFKKIKLSSKSVRLQVGKRRWFALLLNR